MTSVIQFPVHDLSYPRNSRIRSYLESQGFSVAVASYDELEPHRPLSLSFIKRLRDLFQPFDIVIITEFQSRYTLPVKLALAGTGKKLIVDGFVGRYETEVEDWNRARPRSMRAIRYRAVDFVARSQPDMYLIDTLIRAEDLQRLTNTPVVNLAVGSPNWARPADAQPSQRGSDPLRILYYGNYIPLHGFDTFVRALSHAVNAGADISVRAIGSGELRPPIESLVESLGLSHVIDFHEPVPEQDLASHSHWSDVVLGVFGTSRKAETVLANKVWQGLACGRRVLTRSSPALEEFSFLPRDQVILAEPTVEAISSVLIGLAAKHRNNAHAYAGRFSESHVQLEEYTASTYEVFGQELNRMLSA